MTRLLVPMDDTEMGERALRHAFEFHPDSEITVLHVVGNPSTMLGPATTLALEDDVGDAADEAATPVFETADRIAAEYDRSVNSVVDVGHPVAAVLDAAEEADLVVIGAHSGGLADRLFVGNVSEKIVRQSPVPVTVVR